MCCNVLLLLLVSTGKALMLKMSQMVPQHVGRSKRAAAGKSGAEASGSSSSNSAAATSKQSGKKGKKKK